MISIPKRRWSTAASGARTARLVAAALFVSLVAAGPAMAGTLQVTFDAYDNGGTGCGIWSINGDSAFGIDPPCSGAHSVSTEAVVARCPPAHGLGFDERTTGDRDHRCICKPV